MFAGSRSISRVGSDCCLLRIGSVVSRVRVILCIRSRVVPGVLICCIRLCVVFYILSG